MLIGRSATNDDKNGATAKVKQRIFDWLVGLQLQFLTVLHKAMETKAKLFYQLISPVTGGCPGGVK
jgi:hypothetical protein